MFSLVFVPPRINLASRLQDLQKICLLCHKQVVTYFLVKLRIYATRANSATYENTSDVNPSFYSAPCDYLYKFTTKAGYQYLIILEFSVKPLN